MNKEDVYWNFFPIDWLGNNDDKKTISRRGGVRSSGLREEESTQVKRTSFWTEVGAKQTICRSETVRSGGRIHQDLPPEDF